MRQLADIISQFDGVFSYDDFAVTAEALTAQCAQLGRRVKFVQIGAMDGVYADPIHDYVMRLQWQGLLVEPLPHMFAKLQQNYAPRAANLKFANVAVAEQAGEVEFFFVPPEAAAQHGLDAAALGISSMMTDRGVLFDASVAIDAAVAEKIRALRQSVRVPALPLADLLVQHDVQQLDVLVCDVEGADWLVLQQLDLTTYSPRLVLVECLHLTAAELQAMLEKMRAHGYTALLEKQQGQDALFVRL